MNAIYHNFIINASREKVFSAVSEPELFKNWWPKKCSGKPEVGREYNFVFEEPYDWYARVEVLEPDKTIHFKMTKSDPDWDPTTFGFDLREVPNGTYVSFFHKDWPHVNDHMKFSSFCWAMLLNGLKNYLEKGQIIPFSERS